MVSLISRVDTAHRDMIHDAQMDYYGTRLATCSSDRTVRIFEVKPNGQHQKIAELQGHDGPIWQVTWSHPMYGPLLASGSYDKKVIIWKETQGKWGRLYESTGFESSVNSVTWGPAEYGLILAAGSSDGSISLISTTGAGDWETVKIANAHPIGCNAVCWCPSVAPGSIIDPNKQPITIKRIVSGGCDQLVKIWKENNDGQWIEEHKLEGHKDWVRDVSWAPSIGLPTSTIASCSQDHRVIIWRTSDLDGGVWTPTILHSFDDVVWHVSWSICGGILAVSGGDNKVTLWKENLEGEWRCISDSSKTGNDVSRG